MARLFVGPGAADEGKLTIEEVGAECVDVYYHASQARIDNYTQINNEVASSPKMRLLQVNGAADVVTMYPVVTLPNQRFMKPKYPWIESIALAGFGFGVPDSVQAVQGILEELPEGFVKDYDYGLGLQKDYDYVINALRHVPEIRCLAICREEETEMLGPIFVIKEWDFDAIRKGINRITRKKQGEGRIDKEIFTYNAVLHSLDQVTFPERKRPYKPDTVYRFISAGESAGSSLSERDKAVAVDLVASNAKEIVRTQGSALLKLRNDIDLVTLEELIDKVESMLSRDLTEPRWQKFLKDNPFVLGLAFSVPIVVVDEQVSVGGRSLWGSGEKFTDFLAKNCLTNNTALVEIKKPGTKLLVTKEYRGGIFAPSPDLVGAVTQLLDQREKFEKQFLLLQHNSPGAEVEFHSVRCFLIIGETPKEKPRQRNFELYRNNSRGVDIITFDELLQKLKSIRDLLAEAH